MEEEINSCNDGGEYHKLIRENFVELIENIDPKPKLIQILYSKKVIDGNERDTLQACNVNHQRNEMILKNVEKKPLDQIDKLIQALIETNQQHIVDTFLTPTERVSQEEGGPTAESDDDQMPSPDDGHPLDISESRSVPDDDPVLDTSERCSAPSIEEESEESVESAFSISTPVCSIKDALEGERRDVYTIEGQITKKSRVNSYLKSSGYLVHYFTVTICDSSAMTNIRVYHTSKYNRVDEKSSYRFKNVQRRAEVFLFGGDAARLFQIHSVIIPSDLENQAETFSQSLVSNKTRKLMFALEALTPSHVKGEIVKVSPLTYAREGALPMLHLALVDTENVPPVKVTLFGSQAQQVYKNGDCVDITYACPGKGRRFGHSLYTTAKTTVQSVSDEAMIEQLKGLQCPRAIEDDDFEAKRPVQIKIDAAEFAEVYDCCVNRGCRNKKLNKKGRCPSCGGSSKGLYSYVRFLITDAEQEETPHSIFKPELEEIFQVNDIESYKNNEQLLMRDVCKKLPIMGRANKQGKRLTDVTLKRRNESN